MDQKFAYILLFFSYFSFAQLSDKHWIPPLHARNGVVNDHYLYLSTPHTTPFAVTVVNGNGNPIAGSPFTISQSSPVRITIDTSTPSAMFVSQSELNTTSSKGFILEASKEFYVSLKMRSDNHAEILVPKGRTALGTQFRLGSLPQLYDSNFRNFVAGFMATEDNTEVLLSDYDTNVVFKSGSGNITLDTQTFTLNAGQSIVVSGYTDTPANLTGFIGALVTSNKPIVVNSGNACGGLGFPIPNSSAQDLNLDQIVGYNNIGNEYVVVKGNGSTNSERPLIIATEDNTQIFFNDNTNPTITLNTGDYFLALTNDYLGVGTNRNMFIHSNKPFYLYQILAGSFNDATSGLNFIPPLNCYWQKSVNMIPDFNLIGNNVYFDSEIIVVTKTSATVTINGNSISSPQNIVTGKPDWKTYRVAGLSGNILVNSTEALAVGVFGSDGNAAGYGGYYSGFGSTPEDTDLTICSNKTIDLFDAITGNPIEGGTWNPPLASGTNMFDASLNPAGTYTYSFSIACDGITIPENVDVNVTIQQAPNAGTNNTKTVCQNDAAFDLFPLLGSGVVTGGVWSPALNSGTSMYNPAVDAGGTYTYTIMGTGACQTVSANIVITNNPIPQLVTIEPIKLCDDAVDGNDTNGIVNFNLTPKNTEIINGQANIVVTYHVLEADAKLGQNAITNINTNSTTIFVRLTNSLTGCYNTTSFQLIVNPKPIVNAVVTLKQCDVDTDAVTHFNLTKANVLIATQPNLVFTYHNSQNGANTNTDLVTNELAFLAANNAEVWARIENENNCFRIANVKLIVSATTIPQTFKHQLFECDEFITSSDTDIDGFDYFDLTEVQPLLTGQFPSGQSYTFSYHLDQNDAESGSNPITNLTNYRNTTPNSQSIWVRMESDLYECAGLGPFLELVVSPLPKVELGENFVLCIDPVTGLGSQVVDATPSNPGTYTYTWSPTNPNGDSPLFSITTSGTFEVQVKNIVTGCINTDSITTTVSSGPATLEAQLVTPAFSSGLATITAITTGGFGTYEYSLNGIDWQSSPLFSDLENGTYVIYAKDIQNCGLLLSNEIQTLTYPNFFTPNDDGFNDTWNIKLPISYNGLVSIFDRYGKLLKQISSQAQGWNGTFNGEKLPSGDYWFKVDYTEKNQDKTFKAHFSLKR